MLWDWFQDNGWACTSRTWCKANNVTADRDTREGPKGGQAGLAIFGEKRSVERFEMVTKLSYNDFAPGTKCRSKFLLAIAHLTFPRAGFEAVPIITAHLHNQTAKAGPCRGRKKPKGSQDQLQGVAVPPTSPLQQESAPKQCSTVWHNTVHTGYRYSTVYNTEQIRWIGNCARRCYSTVMHSTVQYTSAAAPAAG